MEDDDVIIFEAKRPYHMREFGFIYRNCHQHFNNVDPVCYIVGRQGKICPPMQW